MPDKESADLLENAAGLEQQLDAFEKMASGEGVFRTARDEGIDFLTNSEIYQKFRKDLKNTIEALKPFYSYDAVSGGYRKAGSGDVSDLLKKYAELNRSRNELAGTLSAEENHKIVSGSPVLQAVSSLITILGEPIIKDIRTLAGMKTSEPADLPQQIIRNRSGNLKISSDNLNTVGDEMSERIPVSFTDEHGKEHKGFFTKEKKLDYAELFDRRMKKFTGSETSGIPLVIRQCMRNFLENVECVPELFGNPEKLVSEVFLPGKLAEHMQNNFSYFAEHYKNAKVPHPWGWKKENPDNEMYIEQQEAVIRYLQKQENIDKLNDIYTAITGEEPKIKALLPFWAPDGQYSKFTTGINQMAGHSVPQRNSAMSAVANMLGVGHLIAHSRNMEIQIGNTTVPGVFMENAEGEDLARIHNRSLIADAVNAHRKKTDADPDDFSTGQYSINDLYTGKARRDMYSLQILDYICNNVDRHAWNLVYKVDPMNNQITGFQGFDNDLSFGTSVPDPDQEFTPMHAVSVKNLRCIPRSLADRIQAVDPDMMNLVLKGFDLSEMEREAAGKRLQQIKEAIRNKVIQTVEDADFEKLDLLKEEKKNRRIYQDRIDGKRKVHIPDSLIHRMLDMPAIVKEAVQENAEKEKSSIITFNSAEYSQEPAQIRTDQLDAERERIDKDLANFRKIYKDMQTSDGKVHNGKKKFRLLEEQLQKTIASCEKVLKQMRNGAVRVPVLYYTKEYEKEFENLKTRAVDYIYTKTGPAEDHELDPKIQDAEKSMNSWERLRLDSAKKLMNAAVQESKAISSQRSFSRSLQDPYRKLDQQQITSVYKEIQSRVARSRKEMNASDFRTIASLIVCSSLSEMKPEDYKLLGYDTVKLQQDIEYLMKDPAIPEIASVITPSLKGKKQDNSYKKRVQEASVEMKYQSSDLLEALSFSRLKQKLKEDKMNEKEIKELYQTLSSRKNNEDDVSSFRSTFLRREGYSVVQMIESKYPDLKNNTRKMNPEKAAQQLQRML